MQTLKMKREVPDNTIKSINCAGTIPNSIAQGTAQIYYSLPTSSLPSPSKETLDDVHDEIYNAKEHIVEAGGEVL